MRLRLSEILFLAVGVLSAGMLTNELRAGLSAGQPRGIRPGLALATVDRQLLACITALTPPVSRLRTGRELRMTSESCADLAGRILATMPTHPSAYLVQALVSDRARDRAGRDRALALSAAFAPFEGWLAQRRFALAVAASEPDAQGGAPTAPAPDPVLERDIATLLTFQSGAELLARYYVLRPGVRDLIAAQAGLASPHDQTRFLNQLRKRGQRS